MPRRSAKLGQSVLDLDIDDSRFHSKLSGAYNAAEKFTDRTGTNLQKAGKAIGGLGQSWTRNVTLPIVAAGGAAAKMGLDFDTTLRQVVGLTDVTADQIGGIREELMLLAPEVGRGPQELAEAFYFVSSAGFTADEAMDVLRTSAKAAATGLGETQSVAQVLGSVINAYGKENITAARAADILVEAISQGTAEAPEFAAVIGRVAPTAAALGVTFDQVAASLAGMTLTGLSAEESATSLNQVFVSLLKPTGQAETALAEMGLSAAGLRRQLKEEGLLATLRTLEERFAGNDEAAASVFGNVRALRGVTSLLTLDTEQLNSVFSKVDDSLGRLEQGYSDTAGPQRDLDKSMAELQVTAIEIGTDVMPIVVEVLGAVADAAGGLSDAWGELDDDTKQLVIQALAFLAVAGPVLIMFGKLTSGAGYLLKAIAFLGGAKGIPLLVKWLGRIGPAGLGAIGIITALGTAVHELGGNAEVVDKLGRLKDAMEDVGLTGEDFARGVEKSGKSASDFTDRMLELIDTGVPVRDALRIVSEGLDSVDWQKHNTSLEESGRAWEAYQNQISGGTAEAVDAAALEAAGLPPELAAILSEGDLAGPASELMDPVAEEAEKARELAVQAMADMLKGISNLFETDETLRDAWQALIDRMDDPYTEAERKADIFSQNTIDNIRGALQSGDPDIQGDAVELVDNMLSQIALMEPGALESGEAVPPALRDGMDGEMGALISWIETNVTGESLTALSLDEANEIGLGGIWRYAQGMRRGEYQAFLAANSVAIATNRGLRIDGTAYQGGWAVGSSWINGIVQSIYNGNRGVSRAMWTIRNFLGGSLPEAGPLEGDTAAKGGRSIGSSWTTSIAEAIGAGVRAIESSVGGVGRSLALSGSGLATPALPDLHGIRVAAGASASDSLGTTIYNPEYHLHAYGLDLSIERREQMLQALEGVARFDDGAVGIHG